MVRLHNERIRHFLGIKPGEFYRGIGECIAGDNPAQRDAAATSLDFDGIATHRLRHGDAEPIDIQIGGDDIGLRPVSLVQERQRTGARGHRGDDDLGGTEGH